MSRQFGPDALSEVANLAGPELLDEVRDGLEAINPVNFALFSGAVRSTESTRHGNTVIGVGEYLPGIDHPTRINIPATMASERPKANKVRSEVSVPRLSIVADLPERLNRTSGQLNERTIGRYAVALGLVMAERARASASVILSDVYSSREVFNDFATESVEAMEAMENIDHSSNLANQDGRSGLLSALDNAETELVEQKDVTLVVSDFMGGYNKDTATFDWEDSLSRLSGSLDDRLLAVRLTSWSQYELPTVATGLPLDRVRAVRSAYFEEAQQKAQRLAAVFQNLRGLSVDADSTAVHPVVQVNEFLVGTDEY